MLELTHFLALFASAFIAATLLPLQSEAVLVGMLLSERDAAWLLLATATSGNVLGSMVNWLLGRYLLHFRHKRWFPVSEGQLNKAEKSYRRYGYWSLLLSWLPVVGDPLTVIAGVFREPFWRFTLLVGIAKFTRYLLLAALTLGWT